MTIFKITFLKMDKIFFLSINPTALFQVYYHVHGVESSSQRSFRMSKTGDKKNSGNRKKNKKSLQLTCVRNTVVFEVRNDYF